MNPILIVDDEKDNLEALQRLLRNQYAVTSTTSPFEALKLIQKSRFNVILSDQRMPEMSGVELLEKAKQVAASTTRVLLTGYTDMDSVIGAINRGNIYRYIAKPWDPEDLKQTLRQADEACVLRRELETKNQELLASNSELKRVLAELQMLDQAKARFLSLVSHELNTPLTILMSFSQLLTDRKGMDADMQKAVAGITGATSRFQQIVSEVITYVKLESEAKFQLKDFDLAQEATALVKTQKEQKNIKLEIREKVTVRCDPDKTRLAMKRLLEESIRRSPDKSEVRVEVGCDHSVGTFSVWRRGQKLPEGAFLPFVTPGQELHHHRDLGLGLAICRLIVEGQGGEVALDSTDTSGTKVTFRLSL